MNDDKTRKVIGRWKKGGQRNRREDSKVLKKLQDQRRPGWRNGAKVDVRPFASAERIDFIARQILAARMMNAPFGRC